MKLLYTLLLFQDVSGGELLLVLLVVFLMFGPKKLPEMAKGLAKGLAKLKKATDDIRSEVNDAIDPLVKELKDQSDTMKVDLNLTKKQNPPVNPTEQNNSDEKPAG